MKLVIWNCQGALRKKTDIIDFDSDVTIISECSKADSAGAAIWHGNNERKGIAVYSKFKIELIDSPRFKHVLPLRMDDAFTLLAVWSQACHETGSYTRQIWHAVNYYNFDIDIIAGDWNSNKIWDYKRDIGNHSDVVKYLSDKNIHSAYHTYFKEEHGKETRPTFYMNRNRAKPYHIDYCFVSDKFKVESVRVVEVSCSDHFPVVVLLS